MRSKIGLVRTCLRRGLSLLELLAAISIMGVIALVVVPRLNESADQAGDGSCQLRKAVIELQTSQWHREKGVWPKADLSDIGSDVRFFADGVPQCPVDGTGYTVNAATGRVNGHIH